MTGEGGGLDDAIREGLERGRKLRQQDERTQRTLDDVRRTRAEEQQRILEEYQQKIPAIEAVTVRFLATVRRHGNPGVETGWKTTENYQGPAHPLWELGSTRLALPFEDHSNLYLLLPVPYRRLFSRPTRPRFLLTEKFQTTQGATDYLLGSLRMQEPHLHDVSENAARIRNLEYGVPGKLAEILGRAGLDFDDG
ncbi:hypothetical protein [Frankia tisae]|uniref:hypothetical protein n=1 Tax=Frankia tisae TaxID=2950104 RepID=UPI0021BF0900|nr:hypothetical protein [Frankia tisae]